MSIDIERTKHWIPFIPVASDAEEKIKQTLDACYAIHVWTANNLKERFLETLAVPPDHEIRINLTRFIAESDLKQAAQRYSLDRAAEQTARRFRQKVRFIQDNQIEFPLTIPQDEYCEITIAPRKVWQRYLEFYGSVSTTFGMLVLEDTLNRVLQIQAAEMRVGSAYLPYLWHSATIRIAHRYQLRFNFHHPQSVQGRKGKKKRNEERSNEPTMDTLRRDNAQRDA